MYQREANSHERLSHSEQLLKNIHPMMLARVEFLLSVIELFLSLTVEALRQNVSKLAAFRRE